MQISEPTMKSLKPFWRRVSVLPSPVDESMRGSGVIVPITLSTGVKRGVCVNVHESYEGHGIEAGTVVYYLGDGFQIGDVQIVDMEDIVAYEND